MTMQAVTQQMSIGWHVWTAIQREDFAQAARCLQQLDNPHWLRRWLQPRVLHGLQLDATQALLGLRLDEAWHTVTLAQSLVAPQSITQINPWTQLHQQLALHSIQRIERAITANAWTDAQRYLKQLESQPLDDWRIARLQQMLLPLSELSSNQPDSPNAQDGIPTSDVANHSTTNQSSKPSCGTEDRADLQHPGSANCDTDFPSAVMMWIDGIGGFLLVTSPEAWIGRYVEQPGVQIALAADLHRRHAKIDYLDNAHWLSLNGPGQVDGEPIRQTHRLTSGQTISLGNSIEMCYRQPYPNTGTATLTMSAAQRTIPWSDAIILLGDSLMIGSGRRSHLYCPDWNRTLVFFRRRGQLFLRCGGSTLYNPVELNGQRIDGATHQVTERSRVVGDQFSITFEPLEIVNSSPSR
jgi:hypothetical protein